MALDETLAGFNINTSAAAEFVLQEIMNVVWPQAFIINQKLQPVMNNQLLESASVTSSSPQTVVYKLNPKAVWSDGTPITADDFIYNWQAQSGNAAYTDVGGKPYDAASTTGYNQIQSVVGSDPSGGAACDPGSSADRNVGLCPNGRTVTVTFKPSFTDWRSLYTDIVPAHIARTVGWNTGFTGPAQVISGSWFKIQSYNENQSVVLVRNPTYWGTPAKLSKLVFQFFSADSQLVPALQNGEIDIFNPATVNLSIVQTSNQVPDTTKATLPGLEFEHFDFNQADPYLAKLQVREAIAHGVNRAATDPAHGRRDRQGHQAARQPHVHVQPDGLQGHELRLQPEHLTELAEGARVHQGIRRVLPPELRTREGPGPVVHHPVHDR